MLCIYCVYRIFFIKFIPDLSKRNHLWKLVCSLDRTVFIFSIRGNNTKFLKASETVSWKSPSSSSEGIILPECANRRGFDRIYDSPCALRCARGRSIHGRHETERSGTSASLILRHNAREQRISLAKKMDHPSPGSSDPPDCKWHYKSVGVACATSYERSFCRRGCSWGDAPQSFKDAPFGGWCEERSSSRVLRG